MMNAASDRVYRGQLIEHRSQVIVESRSEAAPLPRLEHHLSDHLAWGTDVGVAAWELARCLLADALGDAAICGSCGGTGTHSVDTGPRVSSPRAPTGYLRADLECGCDHGLSVTFAVYRLYSGDVVEHLPTAGWWLTTADILLWIAENSPWIPLPLGFPP
jgi:hypothetical protein